MRVQSSPKSRIFALTILLFCLVSSFGLTLEQLRNTPDLSPEKFATLFNHFEFNYRVDVQDPDTFLSTRSGDCDDFSTLAATVLREKGYTTRLIAIRMPKVVHVVCYVEQSHAYLDYNNRTTSALVPCEPAISQIAAQVANSYSLPWSSASEFSWENGVKRLVKTEVARNSRGVFATIFK
jgi:hypothetical protein